METLLELRHWLAGQLDREDVPAPVWEILEHHGHAQEALTDEARRERLVEYAKALLLYGVVVEEAEMTVADPPPGARPAVDPPRFGDYERERARTLAAYLKLLATGNPRVQEFRRAMLGGELLSVEAAHRFVGSKDASLTRGSSPARRPEGADERLLGGHPEDSGSGDGSGEKGGLHQESALEELRRIGEALSVEFGGLWSEKESVRFVLTGEAPTPKALSGVFVGHAGERFTRGKITLEVEPWVSAETVARAYQYLQTRVMERKVRALSLRNLAVARFVMGEIGERVSDWMVRGKRPRPLSWRALMERWNGGHPDAAYGDERQFYRDFYRAARPVARPYGSAPVLAELAEEPVGVSIPDETHGSG